MNGNLYSLLNQANSFDDVLSLAAVTSAAKKKSFEEKGYVTGFTAKEWEKRFPSLDAAKVVVSKTTLFPPFLYYLDIERGIAFNLQICNGQALFPPDLDDAARNRLFADKLAELEEARDARNYRKLLAPLASEGSGKMIMPLLLSYIQSDEPSANLYDAFIDYYTFCDCGAALFTDMTFMDKLASCKSKKQKRATAEKLSSFDDLFTVYRGEGSQSTSHEKAISWTTDLNEAYFFAGWRGGEKARIITATVRKEDVLEYIDGRGESEVLISPEKVKNVSIAECVSMDTFKQFIGGGVSGFHTTDFSDFCAHDMAERVKAVYSHFENVRDHDDDHSIRVCLFATFLYRSIVLAEALLKKNVPEKPLLDVYSSLMTACVWHDTGRSDNSPNNSHGEQSCEVFRRSNKPDKIAEFLMAYHCKSDKEANAFWRKHFSSNKSAKLVWTAFEIMKDADALDRCRFGNQSVDYVDVSYLRSQTARRLLPVAQTIQDCSLR